MDIAQLKEKTGIDLPLLRLKNTFALAQKELDLAKELIDSNLPRLSIDSLERLSYLCMDGLERILEIIKGGQVETDQREEAKPRQSGLKKTHKPVRTKTRHGKIFKIGGLQDAPEKGFTETEQNH